MKISRNAVLIISALSLVLACVIGVAWAKAIPSAHAAGWNQVFDDEFNGASNSAVDSQWQFDQGTGWGNNQQEQDTNSTSNIYLDGGGNLVIKAINSNGSWTSGRIETKNDSLSAPAGGELQVTASIQLPDVTGAAAQGYWPAFWMLGSRIRTGNSWPGTGEIDAMESVNGTNVEHGTLHCGVDPGGPCNETEGLSGSTPCTGTTCQAGFHTYTVVVDRSSSPEAIHWYLDGKEFWHVYSNNAGMNATTWANAVDQNFFVILNVAIGGGWPGNASSSTQSGAGMKVAYVRAYTAAGSASLGDTAPPTTNPAPPPSNPSNVTITGTHTITNRYSHKALDVAGESLNDGAKIQQFDSVSGEKSQQWTFTPTGDGYYYITNLNSNKVLDDDSWSTTKGTAMIQWKQGNAQANQEWSVTSTGDGYYYLTNRQSNDVLDDDGSSNNNGGQIIQWTKGNAQANQEWGL